MHKIKIAELFYSLQGEGRYVGHPSVFLRTFGCNFSCSGFGMPKGSLSDERLKIMPENYTKYDDLPLVHTGCDSYASWDPRFKHLSPMFTTDEIAHKIADLLPHKEWRNEHLIITGGEPLLGWQRSYEELLTHPKMRGIKSITFETNGTQTLTEEFREFLYRYGSKNVGNTEIVFSVSAKLSASGEAWEEAILPAVVDRYKWYGDVYLKFVVDKDTSVEEIERAIDAYGGGIDVFVMPVGGTDVKYFSNYKAVAELAMQKGWKYSPRLQVDIWRNAWGT